MSQIEQIAQLLKSNLVRLDCWDWKNDTFNEAYVSDCDKVAQLLYDKGLRFQEIDEDKYVKYLEQEIELLKMEIEELLCESCTNAVGGWFANRRLLKKRSEKHKPDIKTKKKCKYSKYTKRLDNCRFDCSDCPVEKSINSIVEGLKKDMEDKRYDR